MSETATAPKPAKTEKPGKTADTPSKSGETSASSSGADKSTNEAPAKSNGTSKTVAIQNGKGSAPRNMGPKYLSNFDRIKWERDPLLKPAAGQKAVKIYR